MRCALGLALAVSVLLLRSACSAGTLAERLQALSHSTRPDDIALLEQIRAGKAALASQRESARRDGLKLAFTDLVPASAPAGENAATAWSTLVWCWRRHPPPPTLRRLLTALHDGHFPTSAELARLRPLGAEQSTVNAAISRVVARRKCAFARDWSGGGIPGASEHSAGLLAAGWLRARALLAAADGDDSRACAALESIFPIASHLASDPGVRSLRVGLEVRGIAASGFATLLQARGSRAGVARRVRGILERHGSRLRPTGALETEAALVAGEFRRLREPVSRRGRLPLFGGLMVEPLDPRLTFDPASLGPADRSLCAAFLDAAEARYLAYARRGVAVTRQAIRFAGSALHELAIELRQVPRQPLNEFAVRLLPGAWDVFEEDLRERTRQAVLVCAASALEYRVAHGRFPRSLDEAMPRVLLDPYSNRAYQYRIEGNGFVLHSLGTSGRYSPPPRPRAIARTDVAFRYPEP